MILVDTHCHLDAPQLADEPTADVVARAAAAGVARMVTIGTDVASSRRAVDLAAAHAAVWAAVGIDPNSALEADDAALAEIEALARHPKVVAVGEIGLDHHWDKAPHDVQARVFQAQLELATRLGRPVVIHCRDAHPDATTQLAAWAAGADRGRAGPRGVMHCFSGDLPGARRLVDLGFVISLAGPVTFKNAAAARAVAAGLPLDALVVETDAPYLAPHPHRGQRNEPALVRHTAACVAELRGLPLANLARATSANAARVFGWPAPEAWAA